jgi:hypothetical protein
MNTPDLSTAAIPELVPMTGVGGPPRTPARTAEPDHADQAPATPDVEIAVANLLVRVYSMFHVDPKTQEVHISVVDENGKLVRLIPPDSVSEMLTAMSAYPSGR